MYSHHIQKQRMDHPVSKLVFNIIELLQYTEAGRELSSLFVVYGMVWFVKYSAKHTQPTHH